MTVFEKWKSYESAIVPPEASAVQREECRRAFYAGAVAVFGLVMDAVGPENEETCEVNLAALDEELRAMPNDLRGLEDAPRAVMPPANFSPPHPWQTCPCAVCATRREFQK